MTRISDAVSSESAYKDKDLSKFHKRASSVSIGESPYFNAFQLHGSSLAPSGDKETKGMACTQKYAVDKSPFLGLNVGVVGVIVGVVQQVVEE
jgi:hypothetical protein